MLGPQIHKHEHRILVAQHPVEDTVGDDPNHEYP